MKFVKSISLFFLYPALMFLIGLYVGIYSYHFFYPGHGVPNHNLSGDITNSTITTLPMDQPDESTDLIHDVVETIQKDATLTKDTIYVLQETDVVSQTTHEFVYNLPEKYIGMNRDLFLGAMDAYEASPPLKEIERGFTSLEVISFSAEKVIVQVSYLFVQPTNDFYIGVEQNYIVVYLNDKETVYLATDILLENLSESIQNQIINYMYIEGEEELYHFLESYSS